MKTHAHRFAPAIAAALLAAGAAAVAQIAPATPQTTGEGSTLSRTGVPNPTQSPDTAMPNSRASVKAEARMNNHNLANSNTPPGQASTTTNHQPNATPMVSQRTRGEVRQEALHQPRPFGDTGERPNNVPTNPTTHTGTPN
jgi:hypothetical protein